MYPKVENKRASRRRKMKRGLLTAALFFGLLNPVSAQVVTVDGMGIDRDSAIRDATRNAVMEVVGVYIDSRTLVEKSAVALDEIYAASQGFVRKVTVLDERQAGQDYRVRAQIDVNDNPNTALMDKLTMLMMLNDPRIAVVVLKDGDNLGYDEVAETAMNDRLIGAGFNHVVDADHVIKLTDAAMLNSIYNGQRGLTGVGVDHAVDFLVLGKSKADVTPVVIPVFGTSQAEQTGLVNAKADLTVKILKYDTGDIIGTFAAEGRAMEGTDVRAVAAAETIAAKTAAEQVENKFRKFAAKAIQGIRVQVNASDYNKVEALVAEIRGLSGVNSVYIREHSGGKAVLEVDSAQKPHTIVQMLKQRTKLGVFVEGITNSGIELSVS